MIVTRFAPSPTGYLHIGHAFAAFAASDAARAAGGRFLLRIEDIDEARCRAEYDRAILEDLAWLGLAWEEPVLRQSERRNAYRAALAALEVQGALYPCFCTRKEIAAEMARAAGAPHGPEGPLYPGTCRALPKEERAKRTGRGEPHALRLNAEAAARRIGKGLTFTEHGHGPAGEHGVQPVDPRAFGDIVVARKEFAASYHLAAVVDDAFQGVTLVTRGHDLFAATQVQRVLQELLGLPVPDYAHHPLLRDAQGRRFAKRDRSVTLRSLREEGRSPGEVRAMAGLASR